MVVVAAVTVLAPGFEPFVQQSVRLLMRNLEVQGTSSILRTATNLAQNQLDISPNVDTVGNSVLLQGLHSDTVAPLQQICTGDTCDWGT